MKTSSSFSPRSDRGSLLIVAMLMSAVIALSLTSYLQLTRSSLTISNRALYNNAAMNLAENGLEEAMYSLNKGALDSTYDWSGWTISGSAAYRKWTGYSFDQNATGIMRVYVYNYAGGGVPKAVSRSTITLGGAASKTIEKWVEVDLKKTSKFSNGLVAKNSITFNGNNVTVDSWDSDPNNDGISDTKFSSGVRNDEGSVGSISVSTGAVATNNGDVWGFVSTAGDDPSNDVGASGSILGETSAASGYTTVDPSRVATDFSASFDAVTAPTGKTYYGVPNGIIDDDMSLPLTGATRDADGNFYYYASRIDFNNKVFTVTDKVILKLTDTSVAIKMQGGSSTISITTGKLQVYGEGSVTCAGNGVSNGVDGADSGTTVGDSEAGAPSNFIFWGTKTSGTQDISIHGNGAFNGVIYAPQGNVTITGNGSVGGSVVANNITLTGNANFHYDESLADDGSGNPYRVSIWKEITSATDRATLNGILSF